MKLYNPLALRPNRDPPTFINGEGTRWWATDIIKGRWQVFLAELPSGERDYVMVCTEDIGPDDVVFYDSKTLDGICCKLEMVVLSEQVN